jgi:preprotein translocase subunit SecY
MPPLGAAVPAGIPGAEGLRAGAAKHLQDIAGLLKLCFMVAIVFNILLAIWIYTDIRKRGEGSGLFIALAILAGIPAAIIYSLVRIGDKKT